MENINNFKIRGNINGFLHTGALIMTILWVMIAVAIFISAKGQPKQIELQKTMAGLFFFIIATPAIGILLQTTEIKGLYLIYSSNFFPLIKRKILISDIASIDFGRNFMPIADPTGISKIKMAVTDEPIVGVRLYGANGSVIGGINTKVYSDGDINLLKQKLVEINPNIKTS